MQVSLLDGSDHSTGLFCTILDNNEQILGTGYLLDSYLAVDHGLKRAIFLRDDESGSLSALLVALISVICFFRDSSSSLNSLVLVCNCACLYQRRQTTIPLIRIKDPGNNDADELANLLVVILIAVFSNIKNPR